MKKQSARTTAWRNLMVAAINAGLEQGLFTLDRGGNLWPGAPKDERDPGEAYVYAFDLDGAPGVASVRDAGWDELSFHAALFPIPGAAYPSDRIKAGGVGWCRRYMPGRAWAEGWLERRVGRWLQDSTGLFQCRRDVLPLLASAAVKPNGYADRGRLIL